MSYSKVLALTAFGGALFMQGCGEDDADSDACASQTFVLADGAAKNYGFEDECVECLENNDPSFKWDDATTHVNRDAAFKACGFTTTSCNDLAIDQTVAAQATAFEAPAWYHGVLDELKTDTDTDKKAIATACETCLDLVTGSGDTQKLRYGGCAEEAAGMKLCGADATKVDAFTCTDDHHCDDLAALGTAGDCKSCLDAEQTATWAEALAAAELLVTNSNDDDALETAASTAMVTVYAALEQCEGEVKNTYCTGAESAAIADDEAIAALITTPQCKHCVNLGEHGALGFPTCEQQFDNLKACGVTFSGAADTKEKWCATIIAARTP